MHQAKSDETIFSEALSFPPGQWGSYLDRATNGDWEQRQRIESLLSGYKAVDFLENPAAPELHASNGFAPLTEGPGDKIGRYKLLQQIGEGGCGVVYMAEQEEPVRRRVALKVIKLGMDTKSVVARFEAERQALALMDHVNIAKVFDAGATETGRPYFVMELVRGTKITEYCDHNNLTTDERLKLFLQVCLAVQHAHQKGIIHRDLKPSNILVTLHDGVAVPKVIDFGIAKATEGRLTDKTLFTAFEQMIGTPAYMSPEQAEKSGLDVDTRSDIYSLGVLLYELLTGKTPFDGRKLVEAGIDIMRRTIRDKEPERPSTKLSTMAEGDLTITANRQQTQPPKLISAVRGDLDWIVMKCLEKDRSRRYETANGLAMDVQRHLKNEPVVARPPSNLYRFRKMVARNKLAFTAAGFVFGSLLTGFGAASWMYFQEREAKHEQELLRKLAQTKEQKAQANERRAQIEAGKSDHVARLLKKMFQSVEPSVAMGRDTKLLKDILDKATAELSTELTNQPEVEAELRSTLGEVYRDLGQYERAEAMHRLAFAIRTNLFGNQNPFVADSLGNIAVALAYQGKLIEAETIQSNTLAMQRRLFGDQDPKVAISMATLAAVIEAQDRHVEAERLCRDALPLYTNVFGEVSAEVAKLLGQLAVVLDNAGKLDQAEVIQFQALALQRKIFGDTNPIVAATLVNLGTLLMSKAGWPIDKNKLTEIEPYYREAMAIQEKVFGKEHPDYATTLYYFARLLQGQGKLADAESFFREALAIQKKALGEAHPAVASSLRYFAALLLQEKKYDDAERLFRDVLPQTAETAAFLVARGDFRARRGCFAEASNDLTRAIKLKSDYHLAWYWLGALLVQTSAVDEYRQHCRESLEHFAKAADHNEAYSIAKECLVLVSPGTNLKTIAGMADTALVRVDTSHSAWTDCALTKSLAEYRQGNFTSAADWAEKAEKAGLRLLSVEKPWLEVQIYAVQAMARYKLKQLESARLALKTAEEIAESKQPKLESGDLEGWWADWIICNALLREAAALIEGQEGDNGHTASTVQER